MTILILLLGMTIGSFLNVCIYRIPRRESIAWPGSHCPVCSYELKWFDLVPVLSYLLLGGKCRRCRSHITWRYPLVEVATGLLFVKAFFEYGFTWELPVKLVFICLLIVIALIDLEHLIIPNKLVFPGSLLGVVFAFVTGSPTPLMSLISGLGAALFFFVIWFFYPQGMGEGDVKMVLMLGIFLGWPLVGVAIFVASLLGSVIGAAIILLKGGGRKTPIPFGLFLSAGSMVALFYGQQLVSLYVNILK